MNFDSLRRVASILRHGDEIEEAGGLLKVAGKIIDTVVNAAKAVDRGAATAAQHLNETNHGVLALGARIAPYAGVGYGLKKVNESEPVQRVKAKIQEIQYNRAMKRAQRGY